MKELLKNKWAWAVLVLVVINIATIGAIWCSMCGRGKKMECHRGEMCHPGGPGGADWQHRHGDGHHPKGEDFLAKELNLTEDQKAQFEALRKEHFEKLKVNFDSMQSLRKSMVQNLGKTDAEVSGIIQKIGEMEMLIQKEMFDHFNKMYSLCTDSQKVQLKEKLENVMTHHGPGFGGHRGNRNDSCAMSNSRPAGGSCCSKAPKRF